MKTDLTYLKTMSGEDPELMTEMIEIFIAQVEEFKNDLQTLHDKGEYSELGKMAHKAKSSVAIMGMEVLADKLKELELLTKENKKTESFQNYISLFNSECDEAIVELKHFQNNIDLSKIHHHATNKKSK